MTSSCSLGSCSLNFQAYSTPTHDCVVRVLKLGLPSLHCFPPPADHLPIHPSVCLSAELSLLLSALSSLSALLIASTLG